MTAIKTFNEKLATSVTNGVATMWCAYAFAVIALISLPNALKSHDIIVIISWIAQTFLQLVLLSIIMVGQKVQGAAMENIIRETHEASIQEFAIAKAELKQLKEITASLHQVIKDLEQNK